MSIKLKLKSKIKSVEGRFELKLKMERQDRKELLIDLKTKKLDSLFPKVISNSLKQQLIKFGYIDSGEKLTQTGVKFINYPFEESNEKGVYNISFANINIAGYDYDLIVRMSRKLSYEDTKLTSYSPHSSTGNEFKLDDKTYVFESFNNMNGNKVYVSKEEESSIEFDINNLTYEAGSGPVRFGKDLEYLFNLYIKNLIEYNRPYYEFSDDLSMIYVKSLDDFSKEDLLNGYLSKDKIQELELTNIPLCIKNAELAKKYAYIYISEYLKDKNNLTIKDMNEVFLYEVLSSNIIDSSIKHSLSSFTYTMDGFKTYLDSNDYQKLEYRLKVMNYLLGFSIKNNSISILRDYDGLTDMLTKEINVGDVKNLYLVMGWPFAKNSKNKMHECITSLMNRFSNIIIVKKQGASSSQKEDLDLANTISSMGVNIVSNDKIGKLFHDRFLVFELYNNVYRVFRFTCEISNLFNSETNEPLGDYRICSQEELVRDNTSLIQLIKEAK